MSHDPGLHITWHETPVPDDLPVTQAYVWALDPDDGRVLLQDRGTQHPSRYNLPGGRPEAEDDGDPVQTAAREAMEESQIRIDTERAIYLGHQVITGDVNRPEPYAQLRYAAPIIGYEPIGPDPDNGRTNRRYMVDLKRAPELLAWGESGEAQAEATFRAGRTLGLPVDDPLPDGYRDGEKHRYLVCHDYGMGALWWWVQARSKSEILDRVADVVVVTRPETLSWREGTDLEEVDIDAPDPNPLTSFKTRRDEQRQQPGFGKLVGRGTVYVRRPWDEDEDDEGTYYLELDEDGCRTRQVVEYNDDRPSVKTDDWFFNPPYDLYDPEYGRNEVDRAAFEAVWEAAIPEL